MRLFSKILCLMVVAGFSLLQGCKQKGSSTASDESKEMALKAFSFTLELQDNRFQIANFMQDTVAVAADLAINFIEFKSVKENTEFAITGQPTLSTEGSFTLSLFYRPDFQLCLPKEAVKIGVKAEGACVSFQSICEHKDWGLYNESTTGSPSCSCKNSTIAAADFRNLTELKPLCEKDPRTSTPA